MNQLIACRIPCRELNILCTHHSDTSLVAMDARAVGVD